MLVTFTKDSSLLWLLYWIPNMVHVGSILIALNSSRRPTLIVSAVIGMSSVLWHIAILLQFFTAPEWSDIVAVHNASLLDAILWWIEIVINLALFSLQMEYLLTKGAFQPIDEEKVDIIECEDYKWL